jgi:L-ascorbate metabolism protein UlaG (beta-lactamase superfamily)
LSEIGQPARTTSAFRRRRKWPRRILKILLVVLLLLGIGAGVLFWSSDWGATLGGRIEGERLARIDASPNFKHGRAQNTVETRTASDEPWRDMREFFVEWFRGAEERKPPQPVPMVETDPADLQGLRNRGIRFVWLGHSTVYLEIDGTRVLIDPVWSERASPFTILGPKRSHPVPVALADLATVDLVVISHDHYDHLDPGVVRELAPHGVRFAVPLGIGADLEQWNVAAEQIIELDWWEKSTFGSLALVATPARHFSGWQFTDRDRTLWASWALVGPKSRVFYSGDTGWLNEFERIGNEYGPFDLTIIKCGAYGKGWPDLHIDGRQAVEAHLLLKGRRMLPVHWLTFDLALHPWAEPVEQAVEKAGELGVDLITPKVGELVDLGGRVPTERWWEAMDSPTPEAGPNGTPSG